MKTELSDLLKDCASDVRRYFQGRKAAKNFLRGQAIKRLCQGTKDKSILDDKEHMHNLLVIANMFVDRALDRVAFKLMRERKDGTLGSLFINKKEVYPAGKWMWARDIPTKGYARRPGWHLCPNPHAPHLTTKGRVWVLCEMDYETEHMRPEVQGGLWYLAKRIRILGKWEQ